MICLENINIRLPGFSLKDVCLEIDSGEFFCLLGPTGSGKTMVLETVAGLMPIDSGRIVVRDRDVTALAPEKRRIGIVYQDCALFPHLSVKENITYGWRYQKTGREPLQNRMTTLVEKLGLTSLLNRSVHHLSGGEKQRVALARALAVAPDILLLDEPLSALDPNFREEIRGNLRQLHKDLKTTVLMVTHDFTDAQSLAQRAAIIHDGRICQQGSVSAIFHRPDTPFVAEFVGMKNVFKATFENGTASVGDLNVAVSDIAPSVQWAAIRPEHLHIGKTPAEDNGRNGLPAIVTRIDSRGISSEVTADASGLSWHCLVPSGQLFSLGIEEGSKVRLSFDSDHLHFF